MSGVCDGRKTLPSHIPSPFIPLVSWLLCVAKTARVHHVGKTPTAGVLSTLLCCGWTGRPGLVMSDNSGLSPSQLTYCVGSVD